MPELPEVETVARQLDPLVSGRLVERLRIADDRLAPGPGPTLAGRRVVRVHRIGKQIAVTTAGPAPADEAHLVIHLRMTGRLLWQRSRHRVLRPPLRAALDVEGGALVFSDVRRFGTLRWARSLDDVLGGAVDPLSRGLTARALGGILGTTSQPLKPWLLRQDKLVGIGNIYASEIPFVAGLSPFREAGSLDEEEVGRLHRGVRRVLRRAIDACGTTFSDFQDAHGVTGSYQRLLSVYGREGEPCRRCGATIRRAVQQQRSTFYCPACQG
jgi:formamidopyrimidine-DNA glycosylase